MHKTSTSAPHSKQRRTAAAKAAFATISLGAATVAYVGLPTASAAPLPGPECSAAGQLVTCTYGANNNFAVPDGANITPLTVLVQGACGTAANGNAGGRGAIVQGTIAVTDAATFAVKIPDANALGGAPNGAAGAGGAASTLERMDGPVAFAVGGGGGGAGSGAGAVGGNGGTPVPGANGGPNNTGGAGGAANVGTTAGQDGQGAGGGGGGGGSVGLGINGGGGGRGGPAGTGGGGGASTSFNVDNASFALAQACEPGKIVIKYTDTQLAPNNNPPAGNDTCEGLTVTHPGGSGNDTINGSGGDDVITGGSGNDIINGNGGNDIICAGSGNDTINGGGGTGQVFGNSGNDTLNQGGGTYTFDGGSGNDVANA